MGNEFLEAALGYQKYGWHVIPLHSVTNGVCSCGTDCEDSAGKHPRLKSWAKGDRPDAELIRQWWGRWPDGNVGIATGSLSGIIAVDVDDAEAAEETLKHLPETATVRTGNGFHRLYQSPNGTLTNKVKSLPGIDVRAEGGLIVVPPSTHYTGRRYEWELKKLPVLLPEWVPVALSQDRTENGTDPDSTAYGRSVRDAELARLVQATNGTRNNTLFKVAVRLFELAKADQLGKDPTFSYLRRTAEATGLPISEAVKTIHSAWDTAEAKPPQEREDMSTRSRFLTLEDLKKLPPPGWLIPNALPEGLSVMYGRFAGGKTFIALDMALTLASYGSTVIYCAGEGVSGLAARVDAWVQQHPTLDPTPGFKVLAHESFPRLLRQSSVDALMDSIDSLDPKPKLLVVDTWRRALAGSSVSSDEVTGQAIDVLDHIRTRWGTSSLILHHPRRGGGEDGDNPPFSGSGALLDNADFCWKLTFPGHDTGSERTMYNDKAKDFDEVDPIRFWLQPSGESLVVSPSVAGYME